MPSAPYFNLATWHTINFAYTRKAAAQLAELRREAAEPEKLARLQSLVEQRAGHWLAMQVLAGDAGGRSQDGAVGGAADRDGPGPHQRR
jgi:hypothetical chaperone protein